MQGSLVRAQSVHLMVWQLATYRIMIYIRNAVLRTGGPPDITSSCARTRFRSRYRHRSRIRLRIWRSIHGHFTTFQSLLQEHLVRTSQGRLRTGRSAGQTIQACRCSTGSLCPADDKNAGLGTSFSDRLTDHETAAANTRRVVQSSHSAVF